MYYQYVLTIINYVQRNISFVPTMYYVHYLTIMYYY